MENKKVIGVAQVLQHLKDGMTREEIAKNYGITMSECKMLFKDARLKGKKTIRKPSFVLVEDETTEVLNTVEVLENTGIDTSNDNAEILVDSEPLKEAFGAKFISEDDAVEEVKEAAEPAKATWD